MKWQEHFSRTWEKCAIGFGLSFTEPNSSFHFPDLPVCDCSRTTYLVLLLAHLPVSCLFESPQRSHTRSRGEEKAIKLHQSTYVWSSSFFFFSQRKLFGFNSCDRVTSNQCLHLNLFPYHFKTQTTHYKWKNIFAINWQLMRQKIMYLSINLDSKL